MLAHKRKGARDAGPFSFQNFPSLEVVIALVLTWPLFVIMMTVRAFAYGPCHMCDHIETCHRTLVEVRASLRITTDRRAPVGWGVTDIELIRFATTFPAALARLSTAAVTGVPAFSMRINQRKLVIIMLIWPFIARRLAGILHARCGHIRAEILVLVTKPIVMTDLLTRHQLAPGVVVVAILIEIVIVEQRCPASDVTAGDSNAGKTEPADRTVVIIADIDLVAHNRACGIGIPSNHWRFDIWRHIPISDRNPRMVALGPDAGSIVY